MHLSRNVFGKPRISSHKFFCDNRINIVVRIKSFAKRIRNRCKIYNEINYENRDQYLKENIYKIQNDQVNYFDTTKFIIEELVNKCSFLSNHDLVLILHYVTTIKKPLIKVCSSEYTFTQGINNANNELIILKDKNSETTYNNQCSLKQNNERGGAINRLIYKCQKTLVKYLIEADRSKTLTFTQRYYLILALQKECDLVTFKDWLQLYESIAYCLTTSMAHNYKTYQIANLLLIYDQISRYTNKRYKASDYKFNNSDQVIIRDESMAKDRGLTKELMESSDLIDLNEDIVSINYGISAHQDLKERRVYDPFNLDLVNICIYRMENSLGELKPSKIVKILYLINSRENYTSKIFQNAIIHFESNRILKDLKIQQILSLFNTYSNAYKQQMYKYIENYIHNNNILNSQLCYIASKSNSETNEKDDDTIKFNKIESLGMCIKILIMEYIERVSTVNPRVFYNITGYPGKIFTHFEKKNEWKDIIKHLEQRLVNIGKEATHNNPEIENVPKSLTQLKTLIKINQILLKLFEFQHKHHYVIRSAQFSIEFFSAVNTQLTNCIQSSTINTKQDLVDKTTFKHLNYVESMNCISI